MGYRGKTFDIMLDKGGLNYSKNMPAMKPSDMIDGSRNLNLMRNGRQKRGGTSHVYASAISGTPQILGICDYTLSPGTQHIVVVCDDGSIYRDATNAIHTGWTTNEYYADFEIFDEELYIVNGYDTPQKWTGTGNTSDVAGLPSDWSGTNQPQWIVKHGRGVSLRNWAGGAASHLDTIYITPHDDGDDFSDANVTTIRIDTGDGYGVIGAIEFGDRLFCFGKTRVYVIDDSDSSTANWGYEESQWYGGAANFRLICKTPNDMIAMMEDGEIYSVRTAMEYGDYKAASLTKPSFMNEWIRDNMDLTKINQFHMVYDPKWRAIKVFGVKLGKSNVGLAMCYFIDRGAEEGWMVHENRNFNSGFDASSSAVVRYASGNFQVYTGDYSGMLWRLEQSGSSDNSNAFWGGWKTPNMEIDNIRMHKKFMRAWFLIEASNSYNFKVNWWLDGDKQDMKTLGVEGASGVALGTFVLDTDMLGGSVTIEDTIDIRARGKKIQFECYTDGTSEDFFCSRMMIDFKELGKRPE